MSRLEDPNYGKVTIQTLLEVASVFDVALQVRFVSFSSFVQQTRDVSASALEVSSFNKDIGMQWSNLTDQMIAIPFTSAQASDAFILNSVDPELSEQARPAQVAFAGGGAYVN